MISSTASLAPRSIDEAIHGSVETGALTTTGTVSPSPPQPPSVRAMTTIRPVQTEHRSVMMAGNPGPWRGFTDDCSPGHIGRIAVRRARARRRGLRRRRRNALEFGAGHRARRDRRRHRRDAEEDGESEEGDSEDEREKEEEEAREAGAKDCSEVGDTRRRAQEPGRPTTSWSSQGAHVYESEGPFGKTERFFAAVDGEPADLRGRARRRRPGSSSDAGFKSLSTDQEENTEAEAHLQGDKHTVDIQVITLCDGKLRIRYTVS